MNTIHCAHENRKNILENVQRYKILCDDENLPSYIIIV